MRSSKSRSRSKSNRNRSMGNIVNRVFDSSGPEGKVRGTPQQIIDKYNQLARDAQLSNDRVAFENFQQHAEHYTRMLGEALREQEQFRQPSQGGGGQGGNDRGGDQGQRERHRDDQDEAPRHDEPRGEARGDRRDEEPRGQRRDEEPRGQRRDEEPRGQRRDEEPRGQRRDEEPRAARRDDDVIDMGDEDDNRLVETPESAAPEPAAEAPAPRPPRRRRPRKDAAEGGQDAKPEAAE